MEVGFLSVLVSYVKISLENFFSFATLDCPLLEKNIENVKYTSKSLRFKESIKSIDLLRRRNEKETALKGRKEVNERKKKSRLFATQKRQN